MEKRIFLFSIVFLLVMRLSISLKCDKVSELPELFGTLLPDFEKLKQIHLNNYFMMETGSSRRLNIQIKEKSVFKILVVPKNTDLNLEVHLNGETIFTRNGTADIPMEFTQIDDKNEGELSIVFSAENSLERQQNLDEKKSLDEICDSPYIRLELYFEKIELFNEKVEKFKKEFKKLNDFDFDFNNIMKQLPVETHLSGFKLLLNEEKKYKYEQLKLHVIKEINLEFKDENNSDIEKVNSLQSFEKHMKYDFKLEFSSDFVFSGSMFFLIIRDEENITLIKELECVRIGKCVISDKPNKNRNILNVVLTPGKYRLLLVDIQNEKSFNHLLKTTHFIPVSARFGIKVNDEENDKYNCEGTKLPISLNTDDQLNSNEHYFEINSEIIINMHTLADTTTFTPKHDSLFRVTAFHDNGLSIDLKLLENGNVVVLSHNRGDTNAFIYSLKGNVKYNLELNYNKSIIDETKQKSCEKIYLRLAIFSVDYHNRLYNDHNNNCVNNLNSLDKYLSEIEKTDKKSELHIEEANHMIFSLPNDLAGVEDLLYKKEFSIEHDLLLNIEVLSDFTSNLIIPIIDKHQDSKGNIVHKFEKMSYQEGSLKIKLTKGNYIFFLVRGMNQFYEKNEENYKNNINEATKFFPKCAYFQLRISSIKLRNSRMKNWECNNQYFHFIPTTLTNLQELGFQKEKDHFVYFRKGLLAPKKSQTLKLAIQEGYLLKLIYESEEKDLNMKIQLRKHDKILKTAKDQLSGLYESNQQYITYYLKPNSHYELEFINESENRKEYYSSCKMFSLQIELISKTKLDHESSRQCFYHYPNIEDVFYERLVGVPNSFYKYGTKSIINLFTPKLFKNKFHDNSDLEVLHLKDSVFNLKKIEEKPFTYSYNFEVKSSLARISVTLQSTFDQGLSVFITKITEGKKEIVGEANLIGYNTNGIVGLSLEYGQYELTIIEANYNKNVNKKFPLCSNFSMLVLLENRPYDHFSKGLSQTSMSCPYMLMPESLSLPGYIAQDTNFSINEFLRHKLSDKQQYTKFFIPSKSMFKLFIPNLNNNVFVYVKLFKETKGKKKKLMEKPESEEADINMLLEEKGTYTIELYFKGTDDSNLVEANGCKYYDIYLSVVPVINLRENLESNPYCNEHLPSEIQPNSYKLYEMITINKKHDQNNIKQIKIGPQKGSAKFLGEFIYNNYIDTPNKFSLLKYEKNKQPVEVQIETVYNENFVWVLFNTERNVNYNLQIASTVFHNDINICSNIYMSHSFHSNEEEENLTEGSNIEKEQIVKEDCKIKDHLPSSFYKDEGENNIEKFGGLQSKDGSFKFVGELLIPNDDNNKRASFMIYKKSVLYVKFDPKYEKLSNIYIQVFNDKDMMFRYGHNEINGVMMIELNESERPYYLDFLFDKTQSYSNCDTFELVVNIIPYDLYMSEFTACDEEIAHIPDEILIENSKEISYVNSFNFSNKDIKFKEDKDKNMIYETVITIHKSYALTIDLRYLISANLMDVLLIDEMGVELEKGKEKPELLEEAILSVKNIIAKLRPGKYTLRLVFRSFFIEMEKRIFSKKSNDFCYNFKLDINAVEMKLKNDHSVHNVDETAQDVDENEKSAEITNLEKKDVEGNKNIVMSVEPPGLDDLRFKKNLDISVIFTFELENHHDEKLKEAAYLYDQHNQNHKIMPLMAEITDDKSITFEFETINLEPRHCYVLKFNLAVLGNDFKDDGIEHVYCTTKCECNKFASFKCIKNKICKCHFPYKGERCTECENGYTFDGKHCIKQYKCDEKVDCNGHGKCDVTSSDKINCICDEGFSSYGTKFCNVCTNPIMKYPHCTEKMNSNDNLSFNWSSDCKEAGHHLPENLYEEDSVEQDFFGGAQKEDGSLNFHGIILVKEEVEMTLIRIPENSIIRVFFKSEEINRASISILKDKDDTEKIAYTEGKLSSESFIVKLKRRKIPYVLRIAHNNLKSVCTRYELKIVIQPIDLVFARLKCGKVDLENFLHFLPENKFNFGEESRLTEPREYYIPEKLILDDKISDNKTPKNSLLNEPSFFTKIGLLSSQSSNEEFVYNIQININKHPVTFTSSIEFDFLTNDLELSLRNSTGHLIKQGEWIIPSINVNVQDNDFVNSISNVLEPGVYYLTITQNVAANHLIQLLNMEKSFKKKNKCFDFKFHIQTMVINKPDDKITTKKFEEMYNRVVDVEPPLFSKIKVDEKFEIIVTFEAPLESYGNYKENALNDAFYLENLNNKKKIHPNHCYIQGTSAKRFLLLYKKNTLEKDQCYILKYNLSVIQSLEHWQKMIDDSPLVHKFCTKSCDCNPFTNFDCGEDGKCICEEPYTGPGCFTCTQNHLMVHYKCISSENCRENFCNGYGDCSPNTHGPQHNPNCDCEEDYRGSPTCDKCTDNNMIFPHCSTKVKNLQKIEKKQKPKNKEEELNMLEKADNQVFDEKDTVLMNCDNPIIPVNLDSLGYLHLDGHMHISGLYSLKHLPNTHFSTKFTLKERSHIKIYIEHSKMTHNIYIIISQKDHAVYNGSISVGPSGIGSSSFIDVILDPSIENGQHIPYDILYFIKDTPKEDTTSVSYNAENKDQVGLGCFNIFMEMQIMTVKEENVKRNDKCQSKLPRFFPPEMFIFDYHNVFYNFMTMHDNNSIYSFKRDPNHHQLTDTIYFHHDYFYSPDVLDREIILTISVHSKFLYSQVGILLEVVEIPTEINGKYIDHKKLSAKSLKELFKDVVSPVCESHCFTSIKKFNSAVLSRFLPSDTFYRIWLFDISPIPQGAKDDEVRHCVNFNISFEMDNEHSHSTKLLSKQESSICQAAYLPTNLNKRGFLGDNSYFQKWGFHILDNFRIDHTIDRGLIHHMDFTLDAYSLFRIVVFSGNVDSDIELYVINNNEHDMIASSHAKNFEDAIAIEIPPGKYMLKFKFFPKSTGFTVCETLRIEFAIHRMMFLQENIERMNFRFKENSLSQINIADHIKENFDLYSRDPKQNLYYVENKPSFVIDHDDSKNYEPSVLLSDFSFVIEPQDANKLELVAFVSSDFSYFDASMYLTEVKTKKTISALHKKNLNQLFSGPLDQGTYVFTIRYYRRLHYINKKMAMESIRLLRSNFAEIEFNAAFINRSDDIVKIMTSDQFLEIKPQSQNRLSHSWLCRNFGSVIPKTLDSMRFLKFSRDMHILDTFVVPPLDEGIEKIRFIIQNIPTMMLRIYVESLGIDIDLELIQYLGEGKSKTLATSKENSHFESIMEIIHADYEYEIVLIFKGSTQGHQECETFKLEIATEINHNYACPVNNNKYALLTSIKPIPEVLPGNKRNQRTIFKYDSKDNFQGDEKNSGYVYMLRSNEDQEINYATFSNDDEIDLKVEISYDFVQSPINIFLISSEEDHNKNSNNSMKEKVSDSKILTFGEIFENRSLLLVKRLPQGTYSIYLYIPGLKTTFMNEKEVCTICDILVESRRSKNENNDKDMLSLIQIKDDNLDIPVKMPTSLSTFQFFDDETYIKNHNYYYFTHNITNPHEINDFISFDVKEKSVVKFIVENVNKDHPISLTIKGITGFTENIYTLLNPGKYSLDVKLSGIDVTKYNTDTLRHTALMFFGISPISRIHKIYEYNDIHSISHQCTTTQLPSILNFQANSDTIHFHNEKIFVNRANLFRNNKIANFKFEVNDNSRVFAEISADIVLTSLKLTLKSHDNQWLAAWQGNVGELDVNITPGKYKILIEVDEPLLSDEIQCLLFGLNIHIFDVKKILKAHELYDRSHAYLNLIRPKCESTYILPVEVEPNAENFYSKINADGEYFLHLPSILYYTHGGITKNHENTNQIKLIIDKQSILRLTTIVPFPKEHQIIPKLKLFNKSTDESKIITPASHLINHNLSERNLYYIIEPHQKDEVFVIELVQEKLEGYTEQSQSYLCPIYSIDFMLSSTQKLFSILKCPSKKSQTYEYKKPESSPQLAKFKYSEFIPFSYFTEKQVSQYYKADEEQKSFQYQIKFKIENKSFISIEFGYDHLISLFDIYLSKIEEKDAFKSTLVSVGTLLVKNDEHEQLPYKKIINLLVEPANYVLTISESLWASVNRELHFLKKNDNQIELCLPFSYKIEIIPQEDKENELDPQILSIFPNGKLIFIGEGDDIRLTVNLNKTPFTHKKQAITGTHNFMTIINTFYLSESLTYKNPDKKGYNFEEKQIYADKVEGSDDGKEWIITFLQIQLKQGYDYEVKIKPNTLVDFNYKTFTFSKVLPTFRLELDKISQLNLNNKMSELQNEVEKFDQIPHMKVEPKPEESSSVQNLVKSKCGKHGVERFDNIYRKWLCSCTDGYTGKYCDICNGEIDPKTDACVIKDIDTEDKDPEETKQRGVEKPSPLGKETGIGCGGCENGVCNEITGKCICNDGYTGVHCEEKITKTFIRTSPSSSSSEVHHDSKFSHYLKLTLKILIAALLFGLFYYFVRKNFTQNHEKIEYKPIGASEFEMSFGASERRKQTREVEFQDDPLVDYEIKPLKERKTKFNTEL